jgi:AraC family transcriptional regulator, transcriptional activator of pobA
MKKEPASIPVHSNPEQEQTGGFFRLVPLELKTAYDTSVPHRHRYYEIFFFPKGGGVHEIDFFHHEICECSIHFVSPGQVHKVSRGLGTYGYVLLFNDEFWTGKSVQYDFLLELPFLNNNEGLPVMELKPAYFDIVFKLVKSIELEYKNATSLSMEIIKSYLHVVLLHCSQYYNEQQPAQYKESSSTLYRDFKRLLEKNFLDVHKVKDYAALLKITEKHLNEVCKKFSAKTASEMIFDRLILEAKRLLHHSDLTIKEIAFQLNFTDPSHFSKFFKTHTGIATKDFRKQG